MRVRRSLRGDRRTTTTTSRPAIGPSAARCRNQLSLARLSAANRFRFLCLRQQENQPLLFNLEEAAGGRADEKVGLGLGRGAALPFSGHRSTHIRDIFLRPSARRQKYFSSVRGSHFFLYTLGNGGAARRRRRESFAHAAERERPSESGPRRRQRWPTTAPFKVRILVAPRPFGRLGYAGPDATVTFASDGIRESVGGGFDRRRGGGGGRR